MQSAASVCPSPELPNALDLWPWFLHVYGSDHSSLWIESHDQCHRSKVCVRVLLLLLHPFNGLFSGTTWVSRYQKGETSLVLNEARDDGVLGWQWHQLEHMQTICTSLQTDNHTNSPSLNFYSPDALPDAQPTMSKHWRQLALDE